jgi:hypothetical protein
MSKNIDLFEIMDRGSTQDMLTAASARAKSQAEINEEKLLAALSTPKYGPRQRGEESIMEALSTKGRMTQSEFKAYMRELGGVKVGAIAADVARMTEQEAFDELNRLDAKGSLSRSEMQRLIDVELRLEQFAVYNPNVKLPDPNDSQGWAYYEQLAAREAAGEDVWNEKNTPPSTNVINLEEVTVKGSSGMGWILGGVAFIALAFHHKLSPGGRRNK